MSELIYLRNTKGGVEAQIWHGEQSSHSIFATNTKGNLVHPSAGGERVAARIKIKDGEEKLGIDRLTALYPFGGTI